MSERDQVDSGGNAWTEPRAQTLGSYSQNSAQPTSSASYKPAYVGSQFLGAQTPSHHVGPGSQSVLGLQRQLATIGMHPTIEAIAPDVGWINERTKYKTVYLQVPMIVEKPVTVRRKVVVDAHEKVPVQVLESQRVFVEETHYEDHITEEDREVQVPHKIMEARTVMVPKQRVVMYEEEQSIEVPATEEVLQQIQFAQRPYTTVRPVVHQQQQPLGYPAQYHTISTPNTFTGSRGSITGAPAPSASWYSATPWLAPAAPAQRYS